MARIKLVAESFAEYSSISPEVDLNEGLLDDIKKMVKTAGKDPVKIWAKLNKEDEAQVRAIAGLITVLAQGGKGLQVVQDKLAKADIKFLLSQLEIASKAGFKGNWVPAWGDAGFEFKPAKDMKLQSATQHAQTGAGKGGN